MPRPTPEKPDIVEKGARDQRSDSRLFMQLTCFGGCRDTNAAIDAVKASGLQAVVYDVTVPAVVGVLAIAILATGLGFVRQVGKSRPHAK